MAKTRRATRTKKRKRQNQPVASVASESSSIGSSTPHKSKIIQAGTRLVNSAVDSALDNFWPIVGGFIWSAVVTAFVAIILYFRAPQSEWLRTVLKYGLAYLGGFLTFAFLLVLLALLGVRRRKSKLRKQSRLQEHVSTEKGPLDYRAELKPTIKNFQRITRRIGKVLGRVASRAGKIAKWIAFLDRISPALSRRSANKGAAVLNRHTQTMEGLAINLEASTEAFIEVAIGCLKSTPAASTGNKTRLLAVEDSLNVMDSMTVSVIDTLNTFRGAAIGIHGTSTMDLNTSLNLLAAVTDELLRIMKSMQARMASELRPPLQRKLSS